MIRRYDAWNPLEDFGMPYPIPNPVNLRGRMQQIVSDVQPEVVHVHGMNYLTTSAILHYCPSDTPVVLHQHTPFVEYSTPIQLVESVNDRTVGKYNLKRSNVVFCVSEQILDYVKTLDADLDLELLMNGVNTNHFRPSKGKRADKFDSDSGTPVFFTLSRMSQKKGVDTLIDGIEKVNKQNIDAHFAVAGDGPMREDLEMIARGTGNVEIMGTLSDDELADCYAASDAFVFTSKSGEAFPTLTMIEALSSGTPVIASRLTENPIGIKEGKNSILFEPGNAEELKKAITELATDSQHLSKMGENARETAINEFSIEDRIDTLESCYVSLTS
jgi:glycosyltransferase involved in cell wall biosynthesis